MAMPMPPSRRLDFSEVPVVDVGPLLSGDEARFPAVVEAIGRACGDVGFMYVKNHGVPAAATAAVAAASARFFSLPPEEKMAVRIENSGQFRGFMPLRYKGQGIEGKNLQEGFVIGHERPLGGHELNGPNQWPAPVPELRLAMTALFDAWEGLSRALLPGFAVALGLPRDHFAKEFTDPTLVMKLNHYPPQDAPPDAEIIGVRSHTDYGAFTILWQDDNGGLEIRNKSGEWVVVPPIPDTYVINIGDMMQVWSNGRFSSTAHRVINRSGNERYSIPMFVQPNYETMIEPLVDKENGSFTGYVSGDAQLADHRRIWPSWKLAG